MSWLYKFYRLISPLSHALLSPLTGSLDACRYQPTCSSYWHQATLEYGIIRGGFLGIKRVLRCNPLFPGGYDPVPPRDNKLFAKNLN
jgi:putative membrane protein insertion efficiency factor